MPLFENNEQLQEIIIVAEDKIRSVGVAWWYALGIVLIGSIPLFFLVRQSFVELIVKSHSFPAYIYQETAKQPLSVIDKQIFKLSNNDYIGYIRIKNINVEWGVQNQAYSAVFKTTGGTIVNNVNAQTYIMPGSEKIIVTPRFTADKQPTEISVSLGDSQFIHKPSIPDPNLEVQRTELNVLDGQLVVGAVVKNNTPFTINRINLPVLLYDQSGKLVGAASTSIDSVTYQETRSFQIVWPIPTGVARAEVLPEVNLFSNPYQLPEGQSQFGQ